VGAGSELPRDTQGAKAPPAPGSVSVIVTVLSDPRVERTLESLLRQTRPPEEILVDDGGITDTVRQITERIAQRDPRVRHLDAPGNIAESRNTALDAATGELVAFLDADEVAPEAWLEHLLAPFSDPSVGFTGGPTPGLPESLESVGARFYDGYLRRFYDRVARGHPQALPMGNSAWRSRLFRELGGLDTSLDRIAASEDQEFALRALARGWRGVYVPEAWVHHDFAGLTARALFRKQRIYARGGYVVWRRHQSTYEARPARLLPYVLLPAIAVIGLLLVPFAPLRTFGLLLAAAGALGLGLLALGLSLWGARADRQYPGLRFSALEIPRRWATLLGAFQGLLRYGWSGRAGPPPLPKTAPERAAPSTHVGKP
jgi:cellulose synthase/poly-beta-1,6-N-acetylglucosamine synthase-like glycosyltransferase